MRNEYVKVNSPLLRSDPSETEFGFWFVEGIHSGQSRGRGLINSVRLRADITVLAAAVIELWKSTYFCGRAMALTDIN